MNKNITTEASNRIADLVRGAEADGYLVGPDRDGTGYYVYLPHFPSQKDVDGWMKMRDAIYADSELEACLVPWLTKNRPYHEMEERIARQPKRPVISEDEQFRQLRAADARQRGGLAIDPNAGDCGLAPKREG